MRHIATISTFLFLCAVYDVKCQESLLDIHHYDMKDGLSQMKVSAFAEDSTGYIYIGTRNGLNQFDGLNFKVFNQSDGLSSNRILGLTQLSNGRIVVLTSHGIDLFDGETFISYPKEFKHVVYTIFTDREDRIWIYTFDQLIIFYQGMYSELRLPAFFMNGTFNPSTNRLYMIQSPILSIDDQLNIDTLDRSMSLSSSDIWQTTSPYPVRLSISTDFDAGIDITRDTSIQRLYDWSNGDTLCVSDPVDFIHNGRVYLQIKGRLHSMKPRVVQPSVIFQDSRDRW